MRVACGYWSVDQPKPFAHQRHVGYKRAAETQQGAREETRMSLAPMGQGAVAFALFPGKTGVYLIVRANEDRGSFDDAQRCALRIKPSRPMPPQPQASLTASICGRWGVCPSNLSHPSMARSSNSSLLPMTVTPEEKKRSLRYQIMDRVEQINPSPRKLKASTAIITGTAGSSSQGESATA